MAPRLARRPPLAPTTEPGVSEASPPPHKERELISRLWRALCRAMDEDTTDRLIIAGIDLAEDGAFAVAELRVEDRKGRRRWQTRIWSCRSIPSPPPDMRWMSFRKFFAAVDPRGGAIDSSGVCHRSVDDWFFEMAALGPALPDFPHAGPAKDWKPANISKDSQA